MPGDEHDSDNDGQTSCAGDCDDDDATVYDGAPEVCDGILNDCGVTLLADETTDADSDGSPLCAHCDDADPLRSPDFSESLSSGTCDDGIDNNCDGEES